MTTRARPADLPDFERPPVTEVALSIQFARLPKVTNIHGGLLWSEFRADYPNYEEHPPLAPAFEIFGPNPAAGHQLEFFAGAPLIRPWLIRPPAPPSPPFRPPPLLPTPPT